MNKNILSKKKLKIFMNNFVDFFLPKFCLGCGGEGEFICKDCLKKIKSAELCCPVCNKVNFSGQFCKKHQKGFAFQKLLFVSRFSGLSKEMVHAFKYQGIKDLSFVMAKLMAQVLKKEIKKDDDLILVAVPLFFLKRLQRGFNQSEILAQKIGEILNLDYQKLVLRQRPTASQTGFKKSERQKNMKDAFCLSQLGQVADLSGKTIVLVDDVYTTGSTINEVAKILKKKPASRRAKAIWALTFAKD
jgi:ComF family protein